MDKNREDQLLAQMTENELDSIKMIEERGYTYVYALNHNPAGFKDTALLDYILEKAMEHERLNMEILLEKIKLNNKATMVHFVDNTQNVSKKNPWKSKVTKGHNPSGYYLVRKDTTNNETYRIPFYSSYGHMENIMLSDIVINKTGTVAASYKHLPAGILFGKTEYTYREAMMLKEYSFSDFSGSVVIIIDTVYLDPEMFEAIDSCIVLSREDKKEYFLKKEAIMNNPGYGAKVTFDMYMKATFSRGDNSGERMGRHKLVQERWDAKHGKIEDRT